MSKSFAINDPSLVDEISSKVTLDLSMVELDQYTPDYVVVRFKIVDGEIKIKEIESSKFELKKLVIAKLLQMQIESDYNPEEIYAYKFTFEKI